MSGTTLAKRFSHTFQPNTGETAKWYLTNVPFSQWARVKAGLRDFLGKEGRREKDLVTETKWGSVVLVRSPTSEIVL